MLLGGISAKAGQLTVSLKLSLNQSVMADRKYRNSKQGSRSTRLQDENQARLPRLEAAEQIPIKELSRKLTAL